MQLYKKTTHQKKEDNSYLDQIGYNATDRNTLYKKNLESLSVLRFHKSSDIDSYLQFWISSFKVLCDRDLITDLKKQILKVKQIAYKHEKFLELIEILKFQKAILYKKMNNKYLEKYNKLVQEETKILKYLNEDIQYFNLLKQFQFLRATDFQLSDQKNRQHFYECFESELLSSSTPPFSKLSKVCYYKMKIFISQHQQNSEQCFKYLNSVLQVFEKNLKFKNSNLIKYVDILKIALHGCLQFERYSMMDEFLNRIESYIHIFKCLEKEGFSISKKNNLATY